MIISAYQLVESKNTFVPSDEVDLFKSIFGNEYQLPSTFREQEALAEKLAETNLSTYLFRSVFLTNEEGKVYDRIRSAAWSVYRIVQEPPLNTIRIIWEPALKAYFTTCWLIMIQLLTNTLEQK